MLAAYKETETSASRVLYINSKDATVFFNNNQSDFNFTLQEPIVVPEHHSMLMSVFSAEIPYSFYNFVYPNFSKSSSNIYSTISKEDSSL